MTERYNPQEIEEKWQERWESDRLYETDLLSTTAKHYFLTMLPVYVGRPARRALVPDVAVGRGGAVQADARL